MGPGGLDPAAYGRILVPGVAANAVLIARLWELQTGMPTVYGHLGVYVGGHDVGRGDAAAVVSRCQRPALPGRWQRLSAKVFCTYALINALAADDDGERARRVVTYHPAWPALSFLDGLDADAACRLLATVIDPRWFRHPARPARVSPLAAFLGLTPAAVAACLAGSPAARPALVVDTWGGREPQASFAAGAFLHRLANEYEHRAAGVLAACRRLLTFLRVFWTCELVEHPEVRFDPARFFGDATLADDFARHWAVTANRV